MVITENRLLKSRQTINPYYNAASLLKRRLLWDLNPESWLSRGKLIKLKDKYQGKKAVIICNGPSLLKSDLSCLVSNEIFTFGLNKINLLFDKSDFRPSCIIAVNSFVIEQNSIFYNTTNIPLFLDSCALKFVKPKENLAFLHSFGSRELSFARDCSMSISQGATVTFVAMQLAFHFGFQEVALIGCDHNFATKGQAHATAIAEDKDVNHFDQNYFAGGVKWNLPDLPMSEAAYSLAYEVYTAFGRKLLNATEGGSLNLLPRVDLKKFVFSDESI
jgi:hypothetical protein